MRKLFSIVARSRFEDEEFFRQTHVPIRLFQLIEGDRDRLKENDEQATEEFRKFTSDRIRALLEQEPDPDAPKERNFVEPGFLESQPYSAWAPKFVASLGDSTKAAKKMNEAYVQGLRAITGTV